MILSYRGFGQPFVDILNIRYQYFPGVNYDSGKGKMVINEYTYCLTIPIEFKNKSALIFGATYDQLNFSVTDTSVRKSLYGVSLQLGYLHSIKNGKWKILAVVLPKTSSYSLSISQNTYQQGGILLFTHQRKSNLAYKFGLYYNSEFFGNFFMPLIGLEWKPKPRINVYGIFPATMNLEYKCNSKLYLGISYYNLTQSYRMDKSQSYVRNGDRIWGNIQTKFFVNYHIQKYIVGFMEAGYTFYRKYEAYNSQNEIAGDYFFSKTRNGLLLNAGIAIRVRLDK